MPKSKNRKDHKKKVDARNNRIKEQQNKIKKFQDSFYRQMREEMDNGLFDDENLLELPPLEKETKDIESIEVDIKDDSSEADI